MATIDTTFQTFQAIGLREDLEGVIYDISPEDTPFLTDIGRSSVKATFHEWQTDALAAVDTANAQIQGDDVAAFPAVSPTVRVGNRTQILRKAFLIAGTLEAVDKAGRNSEVAYQLAKKGKEIKRDLEAIALENIGGSAGDATTAAQMATMGAWLKTNTSKAATDGGDPIYASGLPSVARTDGTQRALTEALFKAVAQSIFTNGGTLKKALFGPINKQNATKVFAGIGTKYQQVNANAVSQFTTVNAMDVYISEFGPIQMMVSRYSRERDVYLYDPQFLSMGFLRPFQTEQLAKTGDAEKHLLLCEATLVVKNEAAHGIVADLLTALQ